MSRPLPSILQLIFFHKNKMMRVPLGNLVSGVLIGFLIITESPARRLSLLRIGAAANKSLHQLDSSTNPVEPREHHHHQSPPPEFSLLLRVHDQRRNVAFVWKRIGETRELRPSSPLSALSRLIQSRTRIPPMAQKLRVELPMEEFWDDCVGGWRPARRKDVVVDVGEDVGDLSLQELGIQHNSVVTVEVGPRANGWEAGESAEDPRRECAERSSAAAGRGPAGGGGGDNRLRGGAEEIAIAGRLVVPEVPVPHAARRAGAPPRASIRTFSRRERPARAPQECADARHGGKWRASRLLAQLVCCGKGPEETELAEKEEIDPELCALCCENPKTRRFAPCGHAFSCEQCLEKMLQSSPLCPLCRQRYESCGRI